MQSLLKRDQHVGYCLPYPLILLLIIFSYLALVGISKEARFEPEKTLIDYNVQALQKTLKKVLGRG